MTISIILPTYNRASFLPEAFSAIEGQAFRDWELIVVDDGSTDETEQIVRSFQSKCDNSVEYVLQSNQGAYAARSTGLGKVSSQSEYIAFYDSDDLWLPHHLDDCVAVLEKHQEVDWVWAGDCTVFLNESQTESLTERKINSLPTVIENLSSTKEGDLQIFNDDRIVEAAIQESLNCGLQTSLIRSRLFNQIPFHPHQRNGEDRMFLIRALNGGARIARLHQLNIIYRVHTENSSNARHQASLEHGIKVQHSIIQGYQNLQRDLDFTERESRAIAKKISDELFWNLGYSTYWVNGYYKEAIDSFQKGLKLSPFDLWKLKTYSLCIMKKYLRGIRSPK